MIKERRIDLEERQLRLVKQIIKRYISGKTVWAYGSRVTWKANESSDLDLAVFDCDLKQISRLKSAFEESNLLISVDVMNWEKIPEQFKTNIKKKYVVLQDQTLEESRESQSNSWKKVKLGDICSDISYGYTASAKEESIGPKFLRITDIVADRINWSDVPYCEITDRNIDKYKLKRGDIVIARTGATTGYNKTIKYEVNSVFASYLIRYRIDTSVAYPFYIGYILQSDYWKNFVSSVKGGSAQPGANAKQFASFEFSLPPLQEQKAIAEVLSSLDDKIELLHKQNKTLEDLAQTLFRKWFIEEAKDDWEEGKLGDCLKTIESGSRPKGGIDPNLKNGIPSIGAESINGIGNFDFSKTKYVSYDFFKKMKKGIIKDYDILIYKDGAYIGKKAMFGQGFPFREMSVNEHIFILRANSKTNQFFIYFLLDQKELSKLNANSAQPGLNQQAMKSFKIMIPSKNMMDSFGNTVKPWIDKILFNSNQIKGLEKIRNTLLPKLMNGKVKLKCPN
ncbi:MAG: restriction endonuclease subunit S [Oligoflexia bacterium]|nr:restriction endonuclease subunit S [Oligoflexia bacterium]